MDSYWLENDTGARAHLAQFGQKYFDDALADAKAAALEITATPVAHRNHEIPAGVAPGTLGSGGCCGNSHDARAAAISGRRVGSI